jgi:hypothetical protein
MPNIMVQVRKLLKRCIKNFVQAVGTVRGTVMEVTPRTIHTLLMGKFLNKI